MKRLIKVLISSFLFYSVFSCQHERANPLSGKIICIDPGHGGTAATDTFRIGPSGEREEWINLRVGLNLKNLLVKEGASVVMTRTSDVSVELKERALLAIENNADIFISIHHNATADSTVNFPIIYFHGNASENKASVKLGKLLAKNIIKQLFKSQTPVSLVSDHVIFPGSGTAVLRHSYGIPGIIGEASFFTNPDEEKRLKDETYNKKEALAYYVAIKDFFKQETHPILKKNSMVNIEPFPVFQEAERMSDIAKLWKQDFEQAKKYFKINNTDSLEKALELFTRSARSFPDSWLAGKAQNYRANIFEMLGKHKNAKLEKTRIHEHYILPDL